jgi:hypothetical protein
VGGIEDVRIPKLVKFRNAIFFPTDRNNPTDKKSKKNIRWVVFRQSADWRKGIKKINHPASVFRCPTDNKFKKTSVGLFLSVGEN